MTERVRRALVKRITTMLREMHIRAGANSSVSAVDENRWVLTQQGAAGGAGVRERNRSKDLLAAWNGDVRQK